MASALAKALRAGAAVAVVAATLAVATPAAAAAVPVTVKITPTSLQLEPDGTATLTVTLKNGTGAPPASVAPNQTLNADVALVYSGGNCRDVILQPPSSTPWSTQQVSFGEPGQTLTMTYHLQETTAPADIPYGGVQDDNLSTFTLSDPTGTLGSVVAHFDVKVHGMAPPPAGIGGDVIDTAGNPVGGAHVVIKDSTGHTFTITADAGGVFGMTSGGSSTVTGGNLTFTVSKAGYVTAVKSGITFDPGHNLSIGWITLKAASTSTASPTAPPTPGGTTTQGVGATSSTAAQAATDPAAGIGSSAAPGPSATAEPANATTPSATPVDAADHSSGGSSSAVMWAAVAVVLILALGAGGLLLRRRASARPH